MKICIIRCPRSRYLYLLDKVQRYIYLKTYFKDTKYDMRTVVIRVKTTRLPEKH